MGPRRNFVLDGAHGPKSEETLLGEDSVRALAH